MIIQWIGFIFLFIFNFFVWIYFYFFAPTNYHNKKKIWGELNNAFIFDSNSDQVIMTVRKPKTIINIKQIIDDCHLLAPKNSSNEEVTKYYLYENKRL